MAPHVAPHVKPHVAPNPSPLRALHRLPAPAKLNLFLRVLRRRPDGYHDLVSAMTLVDWCDWLSFNKRDDGVIERLDHTTPNTSTTLLDTLPTNDLCVRAAQQLRDAATAHGHPNAAQLGVTIELEKHIPVGAGMGGGSSDAALTLMALNHLWALGFSRKELATLGLKLGADVPFFLHGRSALVGGVGEQMHDVTLPDMRFQVVFPGCAVSTQAVFAQCVPRDEDAHAIMRGFSGSQSPASFASNDLQPAALQLEPRIGQALQSLTTLGPARMTGSGSAVFVVLDPLTQDAPTASTIQPNQAPRPEAQTPPNGWQTRTCQALAHHPCDWLLNSPNQGT